MRFLAEVASNCESGGVLGLLSEVLLILSVNNMRNVNGKSDSRYEIENHERSRKLGCCEHTLS